MARARKKPDTAAGQANRGPSAARPAPKSTRGSEGVNGGRTVKKKTGGASAGTKPRGRTATTLQPAEVVRQSEALLQQMRGVSQRLVDANSELDALRQDALAAHQRFLGETLEGLQKVLAELADTQGQLGEIRRLSQEAHQRCLRELEDHTGL